MITLIGFVAAIIAGALVEWLLSLVLPTNPRPRHIIAILVMAVIFIGVAVWANGAGTATQEPTRQPQHNPTNTQPPPIAIAVSGPPAEPANTNTPIPKPTKTPIKATAIPEIVSSNNPGVTIKLYDSSESSENVQVQILAADSPIQEEELVFWSADKDIVGNWTMVDGTGGYAKTDRNGIAIISLPPGQYAMCLSGLYESVKGSWGIEGRCADGAEEMIVFPVAEDKKTDVSLSLALLEVGVISKGNAKTRVSVQAFCQTTDIAGKKIEDNERCEDLQTYGSSTNENGLTWFALGTGVYMLQVDNFPDLDVFVYDISLQPNEYKQIVVELP